MYIKYEQLRKRPLREYVVNSSDIWEPLPMLIFGAIAMIAGSLTTALPETHKKQLPTTLEEGERFGNESDIDDENKVLQ